MSALDLDGPWCARCGLPAWPWSQAPGERFAWGLCPTRGTIGHRLPGCGRVPLVTTPADRDRVRAAWTVRLATSRHHLHDPARYRALHCRRCAAYIDGPSEADPGPDAASIQLTAWTIDRRST